MNGRHSGAPKEEESVPRLRRYFNSLSSHLATLDTSVRLFGDVIFFIRIAGIIAERSSRSSEKIDIFGRVDTGEIKNLCKSRYDK